MIFFKFESKIPGFEKGNEIFIELNLNHDLSACGQELDKKKYFQRSRFPIDGFYSFFVPAPDPADTSTFTSPEAPFFKGAAFSAGF